MATTGYGSYQFSQSMGKSGVLQRYMISGGEGRGGGGEGRGGRRGGEEEEGRGGEGRGGAEGISMRIWIGLPKHPNTQCKLQMYCVLKVF